VSEEGKDAVEKEELMADLSTKKNREKKRKRRDGPLVSSFSIAHEFLSTRDRKKKRTRRSETLPKKKKKEGLASSGNLSWPSCFAV